MRPFVHHYTAVSRDLEHYLLSRVRVDPLRVSQIYNGVDTERFRPSIGRDSKLPISSFARSDVVVIGTVGRMEAVKDPFNLARAFVRATRMMPELREHLRLAIVGDGSLRPRVAAYLDQAGLSGQVWLPGARGDVPEIMRGLDLFVLPSLSEGISNTILEAMATGLPVVATATGGNPELVDEAETGVLVPPANPDALAVAILDYVRHPAVRQQHGRRARQVALERYSLPTMVRKYTSLYRRLLRQRHPERLVAQPEDLTGH